MADLMTNVCTYDSLVNKYANFHVPVVRLYVDGKDMVQEMLLDVQSIEINLSLKKESTAVIRLSGIYDPETRSFNSDIKDKFKLGMIVEVGIGYVSEIQKVLKGFVAVLGAEFGKHTCLMITVMDVRKLMITGGVHYVLHKEANYSNIVETILDKYSKLCTAEIDATDDQLENPVSQSSTDYDFITKELIAGGKCAREFLVIGDKAYFRKPCKETEAICSMEFGRELWEFETESEYTDLKVNVIGYNQQEQTVITATVSVESSEDQSSVLTKTPEHNIVDQEIDTQDKADMRAEAYANARQALGQRGKGVCVGLPELIPGRFVEITMLEEMANKKFYIKNVTHRIDKEGFTTEFEAGG